MDNKKMNCRAPQCGYWREECGCSVNEAADNGYDICEKGEERCENQLFVIVDGGLVQSIYSDKPSSELAVEILDLDNAEVDEDNENALDEMRRRVGKIEAMYHHIY